MARFQLRKLLPSPTNGLVTRTERGGDPLRDSISEVRSDRSDSTKRERGLFNAGSATWFAGPSITETLYDAGRRKAQVDFALAQREQATALYREQALSAFRDVEDQLSTLRVLGDEAVVQQRAVDAARHSTDLSLLRYKRGLAQYLEVLTNQTIQLNDERTAAALVARRIVASTQLQMALGGGWTAAQLPKN